MWHEKCLKISSKKNYRQLFGFRSLANMKDNYSANYLTLQLNPVIDHCCSMFWVIVIDFFLILNGKLEPL